MSKSDRRRIGIDIAANDHHVLIYDYMANSDEGVRSKILSACYNYYQPFALVQNSATVVDILSSAITSANHLQNQIQLIVTLLRSQGIEPTPVMLAQAGYSSPATISPGSIANPIPAPIPTPPTPIAPTPSSPQITTENEVQIEDDDDDDWGEDPPIPEAILTFIEESNKEMKGE